MSENTTGQEESGQNENPVSSPELAEQATAADASAHASGEEAGQEEPLEVEKPYERQEINLDNLLAAGAHFGHRAERWNPKMLPYIYGKKGGVHVINLDMTLEFWEKCQTKLKAAAKRGSSFLFVGTKEQATEVIKSSAIRADVSYVNNRWLGGMLTNFSTIRRSINKMESLEGLLAKANDEQSEVRLGKKEQLEITRTIEKLSSNLGGIRNMKRIPDYMFVVDINRDAIAVEEARKLKIPVIALVDTNTDPRIVDWPVPANDDSRKTIELFVNAVADVIADAKSEITSAATKAVADKRNNSAQAGTPDRDQELKVEHVGSAATN